MIQNAKKILIETETHEIFVVRVSSRSGLRGYCALCAADGDLLTLDESVAFSKTGTLELMDIIRAGSIHSLEASGGHLLVCKNSLEKWSRDGISCARVAIEK